MNKPNCETPTTTTCPPSPLPKAAMPLGSLRITPDRDAITEDEPHGGEGMKMAITALLAPRA